MHFRSRYYNSSLLPPTSGVDSTKLNRTRPASLSKFDNAAMDSDLNSLRAIGGA